jgi:hypothetical protein
MPQVPLNIVDDFGLGLLRNIYLNVILKLRYIYVIGDIWGWLLWDSDFNMVRDLWLWEVDSQWLGDLCLRFVDQLLEFVV